MVNGLRVDYLSPALYVTDLIIISLFFLSRFKIRVPLFAIIFFTLNLLISFSPFVTIYKWLRILEYFWLFRYLVSRFHYSLFTIYYSLSLATIWTSLLAWLQFFKQGSLGGLLYWLGERAFDITTPGIAKITVDGQLILRPYATLPHPNALAGFLLVSGLIIIYLTTSPHPSPDSGSHKERSYLFSGYTRSPYYPSDFLPHNNIFGANHLKLVFIVKNYSTASPIHHLLPTIYQIRQPLLSHGTNLLNS